MSDPELLEQKFGITHVCGQGTNPEQLFAAGCAACFQSALMGAARRKHLDASPSVITAKVGIGPTGHGGYALWD